MNLLFIFLLVRLITTICTNAQVSDPCDVDLLQLSLNLEYLEAEFFLFGALGHGLDTVAPDLAMGGSPPIGGQAARLTPFLKDVAKQFAFQEVGHLRAIQEAVGGFPRPLLDLSAANFARIMNDAIGETLYPPFNPYANDINFLLASYLIPHVGLTGYVGSALYLNDSSIRTLAAGLLAVESGQDAVIRALLYQHALLNLHPHSITVSETTSRLSALRNRLARSAEDRDQGILQPWHMWSGGVTHGNIIAGNNDSVAFARKPAEILRIMYATGDERKPGGFLPNGANGTLAQSYLTDGMVASECSLMPPIDFYYN
ncbi:hypothetical protein H6P81_013501 [Aristolochia fimbriata]|uniref:Desiccation-related protein PCC13-62 n=1 Tax=Aristolochia fimbriata TaxID=158543 RepID=A0AAV7EF52_ARIFI|nr:hypothetical protein H6P81_013501 [Aristolochia fimbriata]